jgi:hypothetical protein
MPAGPFCGAATAEKAKIYPIAKIKKEIKNNRLKQEIRFIKPSP